MFANILLLSLLTIIYGTKGEEGGGGSAVDANAVNFLPDVSQQQRSSDDLNFIKTARAIRTPFRNTEIMTARGFGKRGDGDDREYNDNYNGGRSFPTNQQINDVIRDAALTNQMRQKLLLSQLTSNYLNDYPDREVSNPIPPVKNHRLQIRDGTLKFRLNDGNLRIGRGFGKRSFGADPFAENFRAIQFFRRLAQNQPMSTHEDAQM